MVEGITGLGTVPGTRFAHRACVQAFSALLRTLLRVPCTVPGLVFCVVITL